MIRRAAATGLILHMTTAALPSAAALLLLGLSLSACSVRGFDTPYNKGIELYKAGKLAEASEQFKVAVDEQPEFHEAWYNLARTYDERGYDAAAREQAAREGGYLDDANQLAQLVGDLQDLADTAYRQALELDPEAGPVLVSYAMFLVDAGEDDSAEVYLQRAIDALPDRAYPRSALGFFVERRGQAERAKQLYDEALLREPDHAITHFRLGSWHEDRQDWEAAADSYEAAIDADRNDALAHRRLGYVYAELGDPIRAANMLRESIQLRSRDPLGDEGRAETWLDVALLYQQADRHRQAIESLWRARELTPSDARIARRLLQSYAQLADVERTRLADLQRTGSDSASRDDGERTDNNDDRAGDGQPNAPPE